MNWNYMQPVTIHFGEGKLAQLPEEVRGLGKTRGILITSPSFERRGLVSKITEESGGLIVCNYAKISPNPQVAECEECIRLIRENACDFVVALGGGSVMDCAKAAAVMSTADLPVDAYMDGPALPETVLPVIAVPTTAGTGSEITSVAVLSDHARGLKKPLACTAFYPKVALVDPELTYSVPPHTTACTG
ncbi:MAG: iron-containing alcohol dehydrogenase, partial [Firmicutes bacterium]|nr:iron-containing alcohol dehydrogenase [Bacillota bacterium]